VLVGFMAMAWPLRCSCRSAGVGGNEFGRRQDATDQPPVPHADYRRFPAREQVEDRCHQPVAALCKHDPYRAGSKFRCIFEKGDIIAAVNRKAIAEPQDYYTALNAAIGGTVTFTIRDVQSGHNIDWIVKPAKV